MDSGTPEALRNYPLTGKIGARGPHTLILGEDFLEVRAERGPSFTVPRLNRVEFVTLKRTLLGGALLTIRTPKIRSFGLSPEAALAYEEWRGPLTRADLRRATRSGFYWALLVGVVFLLAGVPLPADVVIGEPGRPADPAALALGGAILSIGVVRFAWTSRVVFLLDLAWYAALSVYVVLDVAREGRSVWWICLLPLFLVAARDLLASFRRFAVIAPPDGPVEPRAA